MYGAYPQGIYDYLAEARPERLITYTVNGEPRTVNYSYRVGLELDSAVDRDMIVPFPHPRPPE
jgi:hypothetical protein